MRTAYTTTVTVDYLPRSLCLFKSFLEQTKASEFGFFCIDEESSHILESMDLPRARVFRHDEFVTPEIIASRPRRQLREYCMTVTPLTILTMFDTIPDLEWAVFLDADTYLYADPDTVLEVEPSCTGILTDHNYSPNMIHWASHSGWHNAGYSAFRNNGEARDILLGWLDKMIAQPTFEERNGGTFQQKILDEMLVEFSSITDAQSKGVNAGPWCMDGVHVELKNDQVYLSGDRLIIYHFQGMRIYGTRLFDAYCGPLDVKKLIMQQLFKPYFRALNRAYRDIRNVRAGFSAGILPFFSDRNLMTHHLNLVLDGKSNLRFLI